MDTYCASPAATCCCADDGVQPIDVTLLLEDGTDRRHRRRRPAAACGSTPAVCWCCRASSTSTATRSSGRCSRAPAWISRRHRAGRHRVAVARERHHHRVPRHHAVVGAGAAQPDAWRALLDALDGAALDLRHAGASAVGGVQPRCAGDGAGRYRGRARASGGVQRPHAVDPEEARTTRSRARNTAIAPA